MEDGTGTQLLEPEAQQASAEGAGAPPNTRAGTATDDKGRFPRRWILLVVIALLVIAGIVALVLANGEGRDTAAAEIAVPDLRGMTLERVEEEIEAAGLNPGTLAFAVVEESTTPSGTVLTQDPVPGALVAPGSAVDIVLARGPAAVAPDPGDAPTTDGATTGGGQSGSTGGGSEGTTPPPDEPPPTLPDLPPTDSVDYTQLQPRVKPGIWNLIQPEYKTVLHHTEGGGDWQSPAIVFGDKPKRISITADGPYNYPIAVWYWGPNDSDWRLANISPSGPGAYESDSEMSGTMTYEFKVGAGMHTILVRAHPEIVWWAVKIEEEL